MANNETKQLRLDLRGVGADVEIKELCLDLLRAETEDQVIEILTQAGFWDDPKVWRYYGDKEDNFSTIGNQQSAPDAALVEKVVNSVDAVLMGECWFSGMAPEDPEAPRSIHEAVALLFYGDASKADTQGHISYWSVQRRTEVSRRITVSATGSRQTPCFTITDAGEGQTPNSMPETLLSLDRKNKFTIQFVQGKYNMGGTGALQFCGRRNIQLVISKRLPGVGRPDDSIDLWGFTVIRREDPTGGQRSSVYTYLAPIEADKTLKRGGVLRFMSPTMPIFPDGIDPYCRESEWGTAVKLFEYSSAGFRSHMFRRDGLLSRLDLLLPELALPIRLHECRGFKGHKGSFETTLSGLGVRLEDDKAKNTEPGFPTSSTLKVEGEEITVKIFAFLRNRGDTYRNREGIIFIVNGQTHAHLPLRFFSKKSVGMGRLEDSILISVDCSKLSVRAREDLFMNSRDRLRNCELRRAIENELETLIRRHQGLLDLKERRKREEIESRLEDEKPLKEMLETILRVSPTLSALFVGGGTLPNPFKTKAVAAKEQRYKGKIHPTYFKFAQIPYGEVLNRTTAINMRFRVTFETDVVNEYFDRNQNQGLFSLALGNNSGTNGVDNYVLNLINGLATLTVELPKYCNIGDTIEYVTEVVDDTLVDPFVNKLIVTVGPRQQSRTGGDTRRKPPVDDDTGDDREVASSLALPDITQVFEADWDKYGFDKHSALQPIQEGVTGALGEANYQGAASYSYRVNMDNVFFKTEMKASKHDPEVLKARWMFGLVLIGMSLLRIDTGEEESPVSNGASDNGSDYSQTLEQRVSEACKAIAPVLLPLIDSLGGIAEEDFVTSDRLI